MRLLRGRMARIIFHAKYLPYHFLDESRNNICHIQNQVTIFLSTTITHYELWRGRKPSMKYFHGFGSIYYILTGREWKIKFDQRATKELLLIEWSIKRL